MLNSFDAVLTKETVDYYSQMATANFDPNLQPTIKQFKTIHCNLLLNKTKNE
jgi:hypothetical protein